MVHNRGSSTDRRQWSAGVACNVVLCHRKLETGGPEAVERARDAKEQNDQRGLENSQIDISDVNNSRTGLEETSPQKERSRAECSRGNEELCAIRCALHLYDSTAIEKPFRRDATCTCACANARTRPSHSTCVFNRGIVALPVARNTISKIDQELLNGLTRSLELWDFGTLGLWDFGSLELWVFGTLELWDFGSLGLWVFGTLGLWDFGTLDLWVFGTLGLWIFRTLKLWGFGTLEL
ncbi:hypothetical protein WH47_11891 [Habropoda laboriosa]|uniref:Uncharacterized protein n=1 Tax=Habropoda laboriosa TaxID=597456 RepID=A0A0L7QLC7_9HYME|nr:hypothetical protein WH47_11891 [Habropoda laboriosa]